MHYSHDTSPLGTGYTPHFEYSIRLLSPSADRRRNSTSPREEIVFFFERFRKFAWNEMSTNPSWIHLHSTLHLQIGKNQCIKCLVIERQLGGGRSASWLASEFNMSLLLSSLNILLAKKMQKEKSKERLATVAEAAVAASSATTISTAAAPAPISPATSSPFLPIAEAYRCKDFQMAFMLKYPPSTSSSQPSSYWHYNQLDQAMLQVTNPSSLFISLTPHN